MSTKIEYLDRSWNPMTGCSHSGTPGCDKCWAKRMAARLKGRFGYPADNPFKVTLHPDRLEQPLRWKKPQRIGVCFMGDLFHDDVPFEFIWKVYDMMSAGAQFNKHVFYVLTKRPKRALEFYLWVKEGLEENLRNHKMVITWPVPSVHIGVSVENQQAADERIPTLLHIPAAVRFVSAEPLLGALDLWRIQPNKYTTLNVLEGCGTGSRGMTGQMTPNMSCNKIDQVIVGGESGTGARPMHPDWVRSLRDQCTAVGTKFYFKQWGEWTPCKQIEHIRDTHIDGADIVGPDGVISDIPVNGGVYMKRVGKKAAGRLLDGRRWAELPEVRG